VKGWAMMGQVLNLMEVLEVQVGLVEDLLVLFLSLNGLEG
jgi:hypothetical protein